MPDVMVKLAGDHVLPILQREVFGAKLKAIVAETLGVPGTPLKPTDVEVDFSYFSRGAQSNGYDCTVRVEADDYPERLNRRQEFADLIADVLKRHQMFPRPTRFFVWVRFAPGGFAERQT